MIFLISDSAGIHWFQTKSYDAARVAADTLNPLGNSRVTTFCGDLESLAILEIRGHGSDPRTGLKRGILRLPCTSLSDLDAIILKRYGQKSPGMLAPSDVHEVLTEMERKRFPGSNSSVFWLTAKEYFETANIKPLQSVYN